VLLSTDRVILPAKIALSLGFHGQDSEVETLFDQRHIVLRQYEPMLILRMRYLDHHLASFRCAAR